MTIRIKYIPSCGNEIRTYTNVKGLVEFNNNDGVTRLLILFNDSGTIDEYAGYIESIAVSDIYETTQKEEIIDVASKHKVCFVEDAVRDILKEREVEFEVKDRKYIQTSWYDMTKIENLLINLFRTIGGDKIDVSLLEPLSGDMMKFAAEIHIKQRFICMDITDM